VHGICEVERSTSKEIVCDNRYLGASMKKSEMAATIDRLMQENKELKEKIIMYQRSFEVGDDR